MSPDNQLKLFFLLFIFCFLDRLREKNQFMWIMAQNWLNNNLKGIPLNRIYKILVASPRNETMDKRVMRLWKTILSKKFNRR